MIALKVFATFCLATFYSVSAAILTESENKLELLKDTTSKLSETIPEIGAKFLNDSWTPEGEEELIASEHSGYGKIVGGVEAPKHEFPWQISLQKVVTVGTKGFIGRHVCGGSIIGKNKILTAGHCLTNGSKYMVTAGAHEKYCFDCQYQQRSVMSFKVHENYNTKRFSDDIGIITVSESFDFSDPRVQPINLFRSNEKIPTSTVCNTTGWGWTDAISQERPSLLQLARIPIHNRTNCQELYKRVVVTDGMICAGTLSKSVCRGDSGGPLVCPNSDGKSKLAGIVSFGNIFCSTIAVFSKVSHYDEWIQNQINMDSEPNQFMKKL